MHGSTQRVSRIGLPATTIRPAMHALFTGQSYIDSIFATDIMPTGDARGRRAAAESAA
jgi:hypothetical protein